jgi:hypothetical protein
MGSFEKREHKDLLKTVPNEPDLAGKQKGLSRRNFLIGAGVLGAAAGTDVLHKAQQEDNQQKEARQKVEKERAERLGTALGYLQSDWAMQVEIKDLQDSLQKKEYIIQFPGTPHVPFYDISEILVHPLRGIEIPMTIVPPDPFGTEADRVSESKSHEEGSPKAEVTFIEDIVKRVSEGGELYDNLQRRMRRITLEKDADGNVHVVPMHSRQDSR